MRCRELLGLKCGKGEVQKERARRGCEWDNAKEVQYIVGVGVGLFLFVQDGQQVEVSLKYSSAWPRRYLGPPLI